MAISYLKLGQTHTYLNNLPRALEYYENGLKLFLKLYEAYPDNISFQRGIAVSYQNLGNMFFYLNDQNCALEYYEKCRQLMRFLSRAQPDNVEFQSDLAASYAMSGRALKKGDPAKAKKFFLQAKEHWARLVDGAPDHIEFRKNLALVENHLANL